MTFQRDSRLYRLIALATLFFCLPTFLGLQPLAMATEYVYADCGKLLKKVEGIAPSVGAALTDTRWVEYDYDDCPSMMKEMRYSDGRRVVFQYLADHPNLLRRVEVRQPV